MDIGRAATYGAINSSPTISTLTLLSGKHESLGMHAVTSQELPVVRKCVSSEDTPGGAAEDSERLGGAEPCSVWTRLAEGRPRTAGTESAQGVPPRIRRTFLGSCPYIGGLRPEGQDPPAPVAGGFPLFPHGWALHSWAWKSGLLGRVDDRAGHVCSGRAPVAHRR